MTHHTSTDSPALQITGLSVDFAVDGYWVPAAREVSYEIGKGEVVVIMYAGVAMVAHHPELRLVPGTRALRIVA